MKTFHLVATTTTVSVSEVVEIRADDLEQAQEMLESLIEDGQIEFTEKQWDQEVEEVDSHSPGLRVLTIDLKDRDANLKQIADFIDFPHDDYDHTSKDDVGNLLKTCIDEEYIRNSHLTGYRQIVIINEE